MFRLVFATFCACLLFPSSANAHVHPEDVARRCVGRVDQIVERCSSAATQETTESQQTIRELLAAGRIDAAHQTGRDCIAASRQRTRACIDEVRDVCSRCIDYLLLVGADQLAGRVRNVCADAIDELEAIHFRVENAISSAF